MALTRLPYDVASYRLAEAIERHQVVVVEGVPHSSGTEPLVELASRVGTVSRTGIGPRSNAESGVVHRVEPVYPARRDPYGNIVRSSTCQALEGHTDDYFSERPADTVMLLCCEPGLGGDSTVSVLRDVMRELAAGALRSLREPLFPTPGGRVAVLDAQRGTIRFNAYEIEKMERAGRPVLGEGRAAIANLQASVASVAIHFRMQPGECLVIDNHRALHGRTAIDPASVRLFRRIRLNRHRGGAPK